MSNLEQQIGDLYEDVVPGMGPVFTVRTAELATTPLLVDPTGKFELIDDSFVDVLISEGVPAARAFATAIKLYRQTPLGMMTKAGYYTAGEGHVDFTIDPPMNWINAVNAGVLPYPEVRQVNKAIWHELGHVVKYYQRDRQDRLPAYNDPVARRNLRLAGAAILAIGNGALVAPELGAPLDFIAGNIAMWPTWAMSLAPRAVLHYLDREEAQCNKFARGRKPIIAHRYA